jgi:hypothetical protein
MPQKHRQRLFQAFKEWFLFETGVMQAINDSKNDLKEEIMAKFSEYRAAVDATLASVLTACTEEKEAFANLLAAMKSQDEQEIDAAIAALSAKQQQIVDAVTGIISSVPSPTAPTPVPPPAADEQLPQLVVPEVPPSTPLESETDPEVPVTVEPSPSGVGVDGGSSISA